MVDPNEKAFYAVLQNVAPELVAVQKAMLENNISPDEIIGIILKVGMVKRLDDGYGRIIVETKPCLNERTNEEERKVWRIRTVQDKVFKDDFDN